MSKHTLRDPARTNSSDDEVSFYTQSGWQMFAERSNGREDAKRWAWAQAACEGGACGSLRVRNVAHVLQAEPCWGYGSRVAGLGREWWGVPRCRKRELTKEGKDEGQSVRICAHVCVHACACVRDQPCLGKDHFWNDSFMFFTIPGVTKLSFLRRELRKSHLAETNLKS